jgi:hypothetical protein
MVCQDLVVMLIKLIKPSIAQVTGSTQPKQAKKGAGPLTDADSNIALAIPGTLRKSYGMWSFS